MRNFDPITTSVPATIAELATTERHLHIDGFDFTASGQYDTVANGTPGGEGGDFGSNGTPRGGGGDFGNSDTNMEKDVHKNRET